MSREVDICSVGASNKMSALARYQRHEARRLFAVPRCPAMSEAMSVAAHLDIVGAIAELATAIAATMRRVEEISIDMGALENRPEIKPRASLRLIVSTPAGGGDSLVVACGIGDDMSCCRQ